MSTGGHTCPLCHYWVPLGQTHSCAPPSTQSITLSTQAEQRMLHRIAVALERIAAVLEGTDAEAHS